MRSLTLKTTFAFLLTGALGTGIVLFLRLGKVDFTDPAFTLLFAIGTFTVAVLAAFFYETMVGYRMRKLTREINNLTSGRSYERIGSTAHDELGVIGRFFDEMTYNIENIATNLETAERLGEEVTLAAKLQADVLPKQAPVIPGIEMIAKSRSAAEVGGDSFDFIKSNGQTFFYIGDVTGHGVPAGLIMMMVNILLRAFAPLHHRTNEILSKANEILYPRIATNMFMTLLFLRWDEEDQRLFYTGCGHEYYLHYHAETGQVEAVKGGGIALGMVPKNDQLIHETEIDFREGDLLVLYTDGITEARNSAGEMFGEKRLLEALEKYSSRTSAESVFDNLTREFAEFVGKYENQVDDITLIVLKNRGTGYAREAVKLQVNRAHAAESDHWEW